MSAASKSPKLLSRLTLLLFCGATAAAGIECGFGGAPMTGPTGSGGATSTGGNGSGSGGAGGSVNPSGSGGTIDTGSGGAAGGNPTGSGGSPAGTGGTAGTAGTGGMAGAGGAPASTGIYQVHGTWPTLKPSIQIKPGTLSYTKIAAHKRFLAESCSIADYNKDGVPDISSGRRWFPGPAFTTGYVFRGGHDDLPRNGTPRQEIVDGVSDDWSDFPWDVDGDGWTDIINIASSDANTPVAPMPMPQQNATGFWYKNPGAGAATNMMWTRYQIHGDMRHEQKGIIDVDGDGKPEIFGACKGCSPANRKGYYKMGASPTAPWSFIPITGQVTFPFGGTGWMHGLGFGDVNGDGKPDMLDRNGVWLQGATPTAWTNVTALFYDGDPADQRGGSHMFAFDVDGDGDQDVVSAEGAHHRFISWYEQTTPMKFVKHRFMGSESAADKTMYGGVGFTEPHALHVADMDGDGVPDVISGKMRFAHPIEEQDPDPLGTPELWVWKTVRNKTPSYDPTSKVTFEPHMVDNEAGVGRQFSVGHINTDGIMDICVATKVGLFVFLGK
jgi:hypothetical protein